MENNVRIRTAGPEDAAGILAVYAPYVTDTAITFEYVIPSLKDFTKRIRDTLERYPYLVAEEEGNILGYAYASQFKERAAYDWAAETSIYIKAEAKHRRIGGRLYQELEHILLRQNIINVNACIAYPNPESIAFHEKWGYRKAAHFTKCGYKHGRWYDMIWMEKLLTAHPDKPECFIPYPDLEMIV